MLEHGSAQQCPNNNCGPQVVRDSVGNQRLAPLGTNPNTGSLGYHYWDPNYHRQQPNDDSDDIVRVNNQGGYVWKDAEAAVFDFLGIGPQKTPCTFNINLTVTDSRLTEKDVDEIKAEMRGVFEAAGQRLVFNDRGAALGTYNGTYSLEISSHLPDPWEALNVDTEALAGVSSIIKIPLPSPGIIEGRTFTSDNLFKDGRQHAVNRGIVSTYWAGKFGPLGVSANAWVGQLGVHEAATHWFLKRLYPGGGHPSTGNSVTRPGITGDRFSAREAAALSKLCN